MVNFDEIMKCDGSNVYPLIFQSMLSDSNQAMNVVQRLKSTSRYQDDGLFRVSVDSASIVAYGMQGDHSTVIKIAPEIINRADALSMYKLVAINWNNLGATYVMLQNLERSLECYCHILNTFDKHEDYALKSMVYYNLAFLFYDAGAHEKGMACIEEAVESLKHVNMDSAMMRSRYMLFHSIYLQFLSRAGEIEKAKELYCDLKVLENEEISRESIFSFRSAEMYYYFHTDAERLNCEYYYERITELVDESDVTRKYMLIYAYIELCEHFQMDYSYYRKQLLLIEEMPDIQVLPVMTGLYGWLRTYYLKIGNVERIEDITEKYISILEKSLKSHRDQQRHALETVESIILGMSNDISAKNIELKLLASEAIQNKKALEEAYIKLEKISSLDGLTLISGRRDFEKRFVDMLGVASKKKLPVSVFMLDIDYFKLYNDTYGHLEGDEVLKTIAERFNEVLESVGGLAARFGGEEFIGACNGLSPEETEILAKKICESIRAMDIENKSTPLKFVTVSVGAVVGYDFSVEDKSKFMKMADVSLYEAKNSGKNRAICKKINKSCDNSEHDKRRVSQ